MPDIHVEYRIVNIALSILLISFLFVPFAIDKTNSLPLKCFVQAHTGQPCASCGLTHSILALYRGDLKRSLLYHPAGVVFVFMAFVQLNLRLIPTLYKATWIPWLDIGQIVFVGLLMRMLF